MITPRVSLAVLGLLLFPLTAVQAVTYNWNRTSSAAINWTTPSIWNPDTGNPGDDDVNDQAILNRLPASNQTYGLILDTDRTIGLLGVNYNTPINGANISFTLTGSHALTVGSTETAGNIYIGVNSSLANTGGVNIDDGVTISLIGGEFLMGTGGPHQLIGTVRLQSENAALNVGTATHRSNWVIGNREGNSEWTASGSVTALSGTGGNLNAHLAGLAIGTYTSTVNNYVKTATSTGTMDLTNMTSAEVDTNTLSVAVSSNGSATGTFHVGGHSLTVNDSVQIGTGGSASGNASAGQNENMVAGTVTMDAGSTVSFGSGDERATLVLGTNGTSRVTVGGKVERTGSFTASGGNFSAYLDSLTLGVQDAVVAGKFYKAEGILDLRNATQVTAFDVENDVTIGSGSGEGSIGRLYLPEMEARIGGSLLVGDDKLGGGDQVASLGLLDLTGTLLTVESDVTINLTGNVQVAINGNSAGLLLTDESAAFTIDSIGGYFMSFQNASLGQYGFAWEGNHFAILGGLIDDGYIAWDGSYEIGLFYESGVTYIGVIPEPGSAALLLLAGMLAAAKIRRKIKA